MRIFSWIAQMEHTLEHRIRQRAYEIWNEKAEQRARRMNIGSQLSTKYARSDPLLLATPLEPAVHARHDKIEARCSTLSV
jgi:hypothetical protein